MADWTMTTAGWGPVRIGSPVPTDLTSQVKAAWECIGPKITDALGTEKMEFFTGQPDGTGPINTLHIIDKTISTQAGIRPGAPLIDLLTTYPHTERFRAPNDGTGDVYVLKDGEVGLFFEISRDDRVVEHISVQRIADFTPFQMQVCGAP